MKRPKLRVLHLEDEWLQWRLIPHQLFDRLFDYLPPDIRVDLEISEEYGSDGNPNVFTLHAMNTGPNSQPYFSYHFFEDSSGLVALGSNGPNASDLAVLDVMRANGVGMLLPNVAPSLDQFIGQGIPIERIRYFSAYPGQLPPGVNCKGFSKGQCAQLVDFVFAALVQELERGK